ncbi:YdcF family protein [Proteiniborus sp. MB09-C3]|uniref:YdcF family protein n=1 Tax=Proteiniborus sp. MB09-C3 TaxID=3050072 RepID=UPI0025552705|nr:YdcF family protein [Proteiniborus sp. MB09-C3]WIV12398.1 YdcF family protein [Proteiniborus sp. MB09-C3]
MKKKMLKLMIILTVTVLISFIVIEGLIIIEGSKVTSEKVDYVIVLGARLYGSTPSPSLLERLKAAKKYLDENKDVKVIVSGGQGANEDIPEAYAMEKYLVDNGIEKNRVIVEDKSTNTFENLKLSLEKIREMEDKDNIKILIATNKFHIFRSKMLAKRLGAIPYGLPAEIPPTTILQSYIREYFAVIKSFLFDRI